MELHDALAEKRKHELRSIVDNEWALKCDEIYKKVSKEQSDHFAERIAEIDRRAREYQNAVGRWRRAYLAAYLAGFASGRSPELEARLTSMEAVEAAADDFKDRLRIVESRVQKDAGHLERPELLYGVLRWLATTYHGAKTGVSCSNLVESCRRASGFWYAPHQSEVTMGQGTMPENIAEAVAEGIAMDRKEGLEMAAKMILDYVNK
jgi:hypothetical protein